ncbi:hypothetical protein ElyMa_006588500 [Elysia marginata]|uniref:Uncharacterized protein n=1 Tax=Elysia marginata TaxID=1093978 RepID=A0AAV4IEZ0_9GAST|nr:hypothetical protein ElyMa_006588500 [Elysia marginata]
MTRTETESALPQMDQCDSQYHSPEPETTLPTKMNHEQEKRGGGKEGSVFTVIMQLVTEFCPGLSSAEDFKKSLHKAGTSIKERPISSALYGLVIGFGFIPFAGFLLFVCGSFALLFTWFIFCQFLAVLFSALLCTGMFWVMLCCFAALAVLLGGTVHTFMLWAFLARHVNKLVQMLKATVLQRIGVPEMDLPTSPDSNRESE